MGAILLHPVVISLKSLLSRSSSVPVRTLVGDKVRGWWTACDNGFPSGSSATTAMFESTGKIYFRYGGEMYQTWYRAARRSWSLAPLRPPLQRSPRSVQHTCHLLRSYQYRRVPSPKRSTQRVLDARKELNSWQTRDRRGPRYDMCHIPTGVVPTTGWISPTRFCPCSTLGVYQYTDF